MSLEKRPVPHCIIEANSDLKAIGAGKCNILGCQQGNNRMNFPGLEAGQLNVRQMAALTILWNNATSEESDAETRKKYFKKLVKFYVKLGVDASYLCLHIPEYV